MASKKKGGRGQDFEWDSDLDFDIPDFNGDDAAGITDDRKPITKGLKAAAEGFGKTFTNEARLRKTLKNSLPREYSEPISKAFEIKNGVRDLYHIAGSEVTETVRETKRSVNRIAKNLESTLPKGMYERIMKWTSEEGSDRGPSKDEIEQGTIDTAIAGMLGEQTKIDAENRKKDQARAIVQDSIDKKRHADMTTILGSIDQSLIALQTYQEKVGTNYMKKSLEMQFRTYFVQNDMLQLQTKYFQLFKDDLAAITKNTGLPDYVKKATKEALMERLREKTFDSLGNSLAKRRDAWIGGVVKKAGDKIKGVGSNIREGASQVLDTVESISSMAGSGMGPSGSEIAGDLAGGFAGGKVQDWIAKKILAQVERNPNAIRNGNKLSMVANNLPQWVNKQMQSGKFANNIPDWLKEILSPDQESSSIRLNREVDLDRAAQFSDKNSRSLNVVIPELLSKIHHELYVTRTGDVNSKPLVYDHDKGKLVTSKERQDNLSKTIVSDHAVDRTKREVDEIFKKIDPDGTQFDAKSRSKIAEQLYGANKRGTMFDRQGLTTSTDHEGFNDAVRKHLGADSTGLKERSLSETFGQLGSRNGEVKDMIQSMIDSGRHGELAEMGLLDLKTGRINMEKVRRMELGISDNQTTASMNGNIFNSGNVQAFARGGVFTNTIVNKPTTFPMKRGKTGVMGEAGPEAIVPLTRDKKGRLGVRMDRGTGDKYLEEIRDILARMEEKGGMGGSMSPEQLEAYLKDRGGAMFGNIGKGMKNLAGKFTRGATNSIGRIWSAGSWGADKLGTGLKATGKWLTSKKDQFDLYVGNEVSPRLEKAKLEAGRYYDVNSKKVITKFEDITGDIKDLDTDKIVLKYTEIKSIVLKNLETGKSVLGEGLTWVKKAGLGLIAQAKEAAGKFINLGKSVHAAAWTGLKKAYQMLTDGPMDVYLKDSYETPVLLKRIMEAGLYFDKESYDTVSKVSDIKGAVVDNAGDVVLTKEDLAKGLYDKNGQEIKTGFDRITQMVGNSFKKSIGAYKKLLGKGKELGGKALAWMKGLFGSDSIFTITSAKTNDILSAIYNLLNDRMPGERSPDLEHIPQGGNTGSTAGGTISKTAGKLFAKAKEKAQAIKDKARGLKDEHGDDLKDKVTSRFGKGKKKVVDKWEALYDLMKERLPKPKDKVLGDTDGDGIREGSIDDIRSKRKKAIAAAKEVAGKAGDKVKGTSAYGALAEFLKNRKKKKEGEEEEKKEDGLGLDDILGDGGDDKDKERDAKKKRRLARQKPQGRFGKLAGKAKGLLGKIPGAGAAGRLAGRVGGSTLGRAGLMAGRVGLSVGGALLGGGLSSAGILTGGLSMLGTALGMTATAIGAILSSPITVPLLAAAAIGTAGYFAYKWLSKPDPQPLEKVRLVQYGWKSTDVEAYKKMKTMEQKVASAVSFSGEKAEFDPKKLNIQDMMKVYGLDPNSEKDARKFVDWFANRFRPIYLNHRALIKTTGSPKELADVDDNKVELKKTYLDQCLFPGDHYSVSSNPNKDSSYLFTSQSTVERQIAEAKAEVVKAGDKKPEEKKPANTAALAAAAAAKAAEEKAALDKEKKKDDGRGPDKGPDPKATASKDPSKMNRLQAATLGTVDGSFGAGPGDNKGGIAGPNGEASAPKSRAGVKPKSGDAVKVKEAMIKMMPKYGINTANQQAALLGNVEHESGFQPISENLNYKPATMVKLWPNRFSNIQAATEVASKGPEGIANSIYGGRMGNTGPTDGWDYRGRGPIQITGKSNYAAIGKIIGKDIVEDPDKLITDPTTSAESALAYWSMNPQLGKQADAGNFMKVRQLINGGNIGADAAISSTMEYLDKIKTGALDGPGGSAPPGTVVASPKPTGSTVQDNPNMGPTPSTFSPAKPSTMVASPRPSYDQSSSGSSAASAPVRSATSDPYYQSKSVANTGDSMEIMKKSNEELGKHTELLTRIADGIDALPAAIAAAVSGGKPAEAPSEANDYAKTPQPLAKPSLGFRRGLANV